MERTMTVLKLLITVFLWPGTWVLEQTGATIEQDGGVFRSMINMLVWGFVTVMISLIFV